MVRLSDLITSPDESVRNQALDAACATMDLDTLLAQAADLDAFRRRSDNLYERVRALLFLHAIHRFHLPVRFASGGRSADGAGAIPFKGYTNLLDRRFEEAIDVFLKTQLQGGAGDGISSALASAYQKLAFQTLADQVRRSVRGVSATSGCSAWATRPTNRCASARNSRTAIPPPVSIRSSATYARPHGPDPLRVE